MVKVLFEELHSVLSEMNAYIEVINQVFSTYDSINVEGIAKFSPATVSNHASIKNSITKLSELLDDYYSNCTYCVDQYEILSASIGELVSKGIKQTIKSPGGFIYGSNFIYDSGENKYMLKAKIDGKECFVCNTKINCIEYQKYVIANKMTQQDGLGHGQCLYLCKYYASDMLRGTFTSPKSFIEEDPYDLPTNALWNYILPECNTHDQKSQEFKDAATKIYDYVYSEVSNGRPVVLQVSQTDPKGRHFVVITGFDSSVKSAADLNPNTMVALDCNEGKLDFLSNCGNEEGGRKLRSSDGKLQVIGASEYFIDTQINNDEWLQKRARATILNKSEYIGPDGRRLHPW